MLKGDFDCSDFLFSFIICVTMAIDHKIGYTDSYISAIDKITNSLQYELAANWPWFDYSDIYSLNNSMLIYSNANFTWSESIDSLRFAQMVNQRLRVQLWFMTCRKHKIHTINRNIWLSIYVCDLETRHYNHNQWGRACMTKPYVPIYRYNTPRQIWKRILRAHNICTCAVSVDSVVTLDMLRHGSYQMTTINSVPIRCVQRQPYSNQ